jgi:hypothetical protein
MDADVMELLESGHLQDRNTAVRFLFAAAQAAKKKLSTASCVVVAFGRRLACFHRFLTKLSPP